jgi:hypothetical protein
MVSFPCAAPQKPLLVMFCHIIFPKNKFFLKRDATANDNSSLYHKDKIKVRV